MLTNVSLCFNNTWTNCTIPANNFFCNSTPFKTFPIELLEHHKAYLSSRNNKWNNHYNQQNDSNGFTAVGRRFTNMAN